jgi:hypothetical protein
MRELSAAFFWTFSVVSLCAAFGVAFSDYDVVAKIILGALLGCNAVLCAMLAEYNDGDMFF